MAKPIQYYKIKKIKKMEIIKKKKEIKAYTLRVSVSSSVNWE